jgi:hypothetical protein
LSKPTGRPSRRETALNDPMVDLASCSFWEVSLSELASMTNENDMLTARHHLVDNSGGDNGSCSHRRRD